MPEWYKKRILQRPGQETQSVTERPSETYQLELPDFRIPTVTNSEDSIITGLTNRKGRDVYNQAYNEHLEQHPVSTWSKIAHAASSGAMFPGDASFSNFALDPTNTTKENAHKYAVEKSGYGPQNPNDFWRTIDQMRDETALGASLTVNTLPALITTANGTFGIVPKLAADLKFGYDGYKRLIGPEGWAKTKNFWKEGRYGRAVLSGLGDALDLGLIVGPAIKPVKGRLSKYSKETIDALKFNLNNKRIGFKMDYPWQVHSNSIPNGTVFSGTDAPALQSINRRIYQSPSVSQLEVVPQAAYASEIPTITKQNATSITDAQWDAAYNEAIQSGNIAEIERLRKLHFIVKTPGNKLVNENNNPHLVWHGSPENWTIFDDWKRGTEDIIYFSTDKSYADQFTIPRKDWKVGMIPTKSSRSFYLYGKEPLDIGTDMDSQLVQEKMRQAWLAGQNPDSAYGMDAWIDGMPLKQSNGIELGVLNRKRMKLSDPITYDDNGQIIPLSKRDDFTNPDIRYDLPIFNGKPTVITSPKTRREILDKYKEKYLLFEELPEYEFKTNSGSYYRVGHFPITDDLRLHKKLIGQRLDNFANDWKSNWGYYRDPITHSANMYPAQKMLDKVGENGVTVVFPKDRDSQYAGWFSRSGPLMGESFVTANPWRTKPPRYTQLHESISHATDDLVRNITNKSRLSVIDAYKQVSEPQDLFPEYYKYFVNSGESYMPEEARAMNQEIIKRINEMLSEKTGKSLEKVYNDSGLLNNFIDTNLSDNDNLLKFLDSFDSMYLSDYANLLRKNINTDAGKKYADRIRNMIKTLPAITGLGIIGLNNVPQKQE